MRSNEEPSAAMKRGVEERGCRGPAARAGTRRSDGNATDGVQRGPADFSGLGEALSSGGLGVRECLGAGVSSLVNEEESS